MASIHERLSCLFFLLLWAAAFKGQLPPYTVFKNGPQPPGYFFLTLLKPTTVTTNTTNPYYNVILDHNGDAVFYQRFGGNLRTCDFKILTNGRLSYFQKNKFVILDAGFNPVDSVSAKNGLQTDNHELLELPNGNRVLIATETISSDLSPYKIFNHLRSAGSPTAQVLCSVLQEQDKNDSVVFEWRSSHHFQFMDVDTFYLSDPTKVDWTHFNSIYPDKDGNYIVSIRQFNEVIKINRTDSTIVWRLGGKKNE
jgi:hypothetical protein